MGMRHAVRRFRGPQSAPVMAVWFSAPLPWPQTPLREGAGFASVPHQTGRSWVSPVWPPQPQGPISSLSPTYPPQLPVPLLVELWGSLEV